MGLPTTPKPPQPGYRLQAEASGCLLPQQPWSGRIVGVHWNALSLLHPDGGLISVVTGASRAEGRALVVSEQDFRELSNKLREENRVHGDQGNLLVAEWTIEPGPIWDPRDRLAVATRTLDGMLSQSPGTFRELLARLEDLARDRMPEGSMFASPRYLELLDRLEQEEDLFPWNLLGLGPGTTPAGDDFIAGYLLARHLLGKPPALHTPALSRTTAAGATLLQACLQSVFPAFLADLGESFVDACAGGEFSRSLETTVNRVLAHGATSGSDALWGFCRGLSKTMNQESGLQGE